MSRYINVEVSLKKTMKIDNDDLNEALEIAKDQFSELELTSEWLDARDVSFEENIFISQSANKLAELFHNDFDMESLNDFLDIVFIDKDVRNYVYEETLSILKDKYNLDVKDIKI